MSNESHKTLLDDEPPGECGNTGQDHWNACPCRERAHKAIVTLLQEEAAALRVTNDAYFVAIESYRREQGQLHDEANLQSGVIFEQNNMLQTKAGEIDQLKQQIALLKACVCRRDATIEKMQKAAIKQDELTTMYTETIGVKR